MLICNNLLLKCRRLKKIHRHLYTNVTLKNINGTAYNKLIIGVPSEIVPNEKRIAMTPQVLSTNCLHIEYIF